MASFKKGLMEFAQGFVLTAGDTIATNIAEKAKQDRADILSTTKELKTRIQKGKAADRKIRAAYMSTGADILSVFPNMINDPVTLRAALSSPAYNKELVALAKKDKEGLGDGRWYDSIRIKNNLRDNFNPYVREEGTSATLGGAVSSFRGMTPPKQMSEAAKNFKEQDTTTEENIRTMFGGGQSPESIIRSAQRRLAGRGAFTQMDIERYGGAGYVPPIITSQGKAASLPSSGGEDSAVYKAANMANRRLINDLTGGQYVTPDKKKIKVKLAAVDALMARDDVNQMLGFFINTQSPNFAASRNVRLLEQSNKQIQTSIAYPNTGKIEQVKMPITEFLNGEIGTDFGSVRMRDILMSWLKANTEAHGNLHTAKERVQTS